MRQPTEGEIALMYVIYGLHAFSALNGVLSPALVVTAFLTGWPSIIAVLLTYLKRADVQGTWLASHFRWALRTFWFSLLWLLIGGLLVVTVLLLIPGFIMMMGAGLWLLYRIIRGLLNLLSEKSMPMSAEGVL